MANEREEQDEMRSEYDFSKLKFVGRGIYAERYLAGVKFVLLTNIDVISGCDGKEDRLNEQPRDISDSTKR